MNGWRVTVTNREGKMLMEKQGDIDPFAELIKKNGAATVRCSTTRWVNLEAGGITVKFEVGLSCDQDAATMQRAGELAFGMSLDLTREGLQLLVPNAPQEIKG